jgi:glutamate-1-semialdehyde 2,1-aminomutase
MMSNAREQNLRDRAMAVIPNGMYGHQSVRLLPASFPQFFERAEGTYLWDADGNRYFDLMGAYGPNLFGYGREEIAEAGRAQAEKADTMTGPSPLMVELAEVMTSMISHADWAIFCKNGTDATTMAMTCARANTGKRIILVAEGAYHGAAPWCTPRPAGVVPEEKAFIRKYRYNDVESLEQAVAAAGDDLAGIFATPFRHEAFETQYEVSRDYARRARELCDAAGAMLIVDEVRAGFRLARDCSWETLGVRPDLSAWGKCLANGLALSALLGSARARPGAEAMYVTGSFWFSAAPMAAALETMRLIRETDYLEHTIAMGQRLRDGLDAAAAQHGFRLKQTGPVQMPQIFFEDDPDFRIGFGFSEAMVRRGVHLHPWHNMFMNAAMTAGDIDTALAVADEAFAHVRASLDMLEPHPVLVALLATK